MKLALKLSMSFRIKNAFLNVHSVGFGFGVRNRLLKEREGRLEVFQGKESIFKVTVSRLSELRGETAEFQVGGNGPEVQKNVKIEE